MDLLKRAVLLHVVALNVTIRHKAIVDDERLAAATKTDWILRVRNNRMFLGWVQTLH